MERRRATAAAAENTAVVGRMMPQEAERTLRI
jgi:hypothetical protein